MYILLAIVNNRIKIKLHTHTHTHSVFIVFIPKRSDGNGALAHSHGAVTFLDSKYYNANASNMNCHDLQTESMSHKFNENSNRAFKSTSCLDSSVEIWRSSHLKQT